jgi:RecB family exonuclease
MFDENWNALSPRYLQMDGVEALRLESRSQLKRFANGHDLSAEPLRVEEYAEVELAPGTVLFGRMDRIDEEPDGTLQVIDYKTGSQPDEIDPDQLRLYAIMVEQKLERLVSKASFWFLDDGTTWTINLTAEDKTNVRNEFLATVREMLDVTDFPATPGRHCRHCPYLHACAYRVEINDRLESGEW